MSRKTAEPCGWSKSSRRKRRHSSPPSYLRHNRADHSAPTAQPTNPPGKIVEVRTIINVRSMRMLLVPVPDFVAKLPGQLRNEHPIIVNQPQLSANHKHVPVLSVAMRHFCLLQRLEHPHPPLRQARNCRRVAEIAANVGAKRNTLTHSIFSKGYPHALAPSRLPAGSQSEPCKAAAPLPSAGQSPRSAPAGP